MARILTANRLVGVLACTLLATCACNREERLPVYPVTGHLFVNGEPAAGASMTLHGGEATRNATPHALVGADGFFQLTTYLTDDGAPAGAYVLTVRWPSPPRPGFEQGADRLKGRYDDPERPGRSIDIQNGPNDLGRIDLN